MLAFICTGFKKGGQEIAMKICVQEAIQAFRTCDGAVRNRRGHFFGPFLTPFPISWNDARGTMNEERGTKETARTSKK